MTRDMYSNTIKRKKIRDFLFVYTHKGVGGIVPNYNPHQHKFMISQGRYGWHFHFTISTLRTWNGYRNAKFEIAFHPSTAKREALQAKTERKYGAMDSPSV